MRRLGALALVLVACSGSESLPSFAPECTPLVQAYARDELVTTIGNGGYFCDRFDIGKSKEEITYIWQGCGPFVCEEDVKACASWYPVRADVTESECTTAALDCRAAICGKTHHEQLPPAN